MAKITGHVAQALARMVPSMSGKTNWENLCTALVGRHQALENVLDDMLTGMELDNAAGTQLDLLGAIVNEPRNSRSDDDYRRAIGARAAANNSEGTVSDMIRVARAVMDETQSLLVTQHYPKGMSVQISDDETTHAVAQILADLLDDARSGETKLLVEYHTLPALNTYTLSALTGLATTHALGATSLHVNSTTGFDESGSLLLAKYAATEETVTYTSKTPTYFLGVSATTFGHLSATIQQAPGTSRGLSETAAPTTGGGWASAIG